MKRWQDLERRYLFSTDKLAYCKGERPDVSCIICEIIKGSHEVERLEVFRNSEVAVSVNLFPYNPGHLIIFPLRHVEDLRELTAGEASAMHRISCDAMTILDSVYQPHGYNLGYNVGHASGASIRHIHLHLVPRYDRELGFIDVVAGSRIIVEEPGVTLERLRTAFAEFYV